MIDIHKRLEELQAAVLANPPKDNADAVFGILLEGVMSVAHAIGPMCELRTLDAMKAKAKEYE